MKQFLVRKRRIVILFLGLSLLLVAGAGFFAYRFHLTRDSKTVSSILAKVYQKGMYTANRPILSFPQKIFDLHIGHSDMPVEQVYTFTNKGEKDLMIHQVHGGCCSDCLTIEWPKQPIQKGEKGKIKVRLHRMDQEDEQTYMISIRANTDPPETRLILRVHTITATEHGHA